MCVSVWRGDWREREKSQERLDGMCILIVV